MSLTTLTRRRTQIELLAAVCARHQSARIALRGPGAPRGAWPTRLLHLDRDAIWVDWPADKTRPTEQPGDTAEVFFKHDGRRLAFTVRSYGRFERSFGTAGLRSALKLGLPTRIDQRQQRAAPRISLAALGPVQSRMTSMLDSDRHIDCRLLNLSRGGMAALANWDALKSLRMGDVFWAEFTLPDDCHHYEFAVRLAHRSRAKQPARGVAGWSLCSGDDPTGHQADLERIRAFVSRHMHVEPGATGPPDHDGHAAARDE